MLTYDEHPISIAAAIARVKLAGFKAGKWGSNKEANPYLNNSSFRKEEAAWEAGRIQGMAARKAGKA